MLYKSAQGGVGGTFFLLACLRPTGNIFFFTWDAEVVFPALCRCMEIFWTAACFKKAYTLGTEYFSQCTTKVGISVLNEMER